MTTSSAGKTGGMSEVLRQHSGLALTVGIVMLIVGLLSLASPLVAALAITRVIGILLIIGGIGQCALGFRVGAFGRGGSIFLFGLVALFAGLFLVFQPFEGLASITLILAGYFLAAGVFAIVAAIQMRAVTGWVWMLANGAGTLALGLLIWMQWPFSGAWAVGILFGIQLMMSGAALVAIATALRRVARTAPA